MIKDSKLKFGYTKAGEIHFSLPVTERDIHHIIKEAIPLAIKYWGELDTTPEKWLTKPEDVPDVDWATNLILANNFIEIKVGSSASFPLTLKKLIRGIETYLLKSDNNALESLDAGICDHILQYAIFGTLKFEKRKINY